MRHSIQAVLVVILFWVLLALLALPARKTGALPAPTETELRPLSTASAADQAAAAEPLSGFDEAYRLPVLADGQVVRMDLHRYLTGALLAEMPLSFSEEALKAQAVACRTYALRSCLHRRHPEAAVCTDSGCCQGWLDPDRADPASRARAEAMVRATDGLAIYDTIKMLTCDVKTICVGMAASMGAVLLAAGTRGKRFALENSQVMIHQVLGGVEGQATDMEIEAAQILRIRERINWLLAKDTGTPIETVAKDTLRNKWLFADEAMKYGLVDFIIPNAR